MDNSNVIALCEYNRAEPPEYSPHIDHGMFEFVFWHGSLIRPKGSSCAVAHEEDEYSVANLKVDVDHQNNVTVTIMRPDDLTPGSWEPFAASAKMKLEGRPTLIQEWVSEIECPFNPDGKIKSVKIEIQP